MQVKMSLKCLYNSFLSIQLEITSFLELFYLVTNLFFQYVLKGQLRFSVLHRRSTELENYIYR